ncbi:MAG: hypothetical protein IPL53_17685 [Ignavibacteria bacterium]|nr:hypothetical protein [Ignavibacteria bacterium]
MPVSYLHVFSYSQRRNTDAAMFPGKVDVIERKRRSELLRSLSNKKRFEFYSKFTGTTRRVLFETQKADDFIYGFTGNYIKVKAKAIPELENTVREVVLTDTDGVKPVFAEIVS